MTYENNLTSAVEEVLGTVNSAPVDLVAQADDSYPVGIDPAAADIVRPVLDSAAIAAIAIQSLDASAALTRNRPRPRPVPGVKEATADPFAQTLLGDGHTETENLRSFLLTIAGEIDEAFSGSGRPTDDTLAFLRSRSLSLFEVASRIGLDQSERLWEIVGTSGSATKFGFVEAWREIRKVAVRHARPDRRRVIARSYLGWVGTQTAAA
jgi:hypothetical protein